MRAYYPQVTILQAPVKTSRTFTLKRDTADTSRMDVYELRRARLRQLIDERFARRQSAFANAINRQADYLSRVLSGKKRLGESLAREIERAMRLPPGWLDGVEAVSSAAPIDQFVTVPGLLPATPENFTLVSRLDARGSCGGGRNDTQADEEELAPLAFRSDWLRSKGARDPIVIDAHGDSMAPYIVHGDVILFDRSRTTINSGQIYLVQTPDGLRVKRVHREFDGSITLRSDNADKVRYPDERVPAELAGSLVVIGAFLWRGGG